jgi:hypothetical protein
MISLLDIEMRGRMQRMTLGSRLGFTGLVWARSRVNTSCVKREWPFPSTQSLESTDLG